MSGFFKHNFSDDTPIQEIAKSFLGLDIIGKNINDLIPLIARKFHKSYINLQPTYAKFTSQSLKVNFSYVLDRLFDFYNLDKEEKIMTKEYYYNLVSQLEENKENKVDKSHSIDINEASTENKIFYIGNKVTLFEFKDNNLDINCYAYFENQNLVIDYWKLSDRYEDEYFITIKKDQFRKLYREFEITNENKSDLLIKILNTFKGQDCFSKLNTFLTMKNISFENSVR